jgi:hypothetical protein
MSRKPYRGPSAPHPHAGKAHDSKADAVVSIYGFKLPSGKWIGEATVDELIAARDAERPGSERWKRYNDAADQQRKRKTP